MKKIFALLVCTYLLTGCAFFPEDTTVLEPPKVSESVHLQYMTAKAVRQDISDVKEYAGEFVYSYYQAYSFESMAFSGYQGTPQVLVEDNQFVQEGDILLIFDTTNLKESLAHAQVNWEEIKLEAERDPENALLKARLTEAQAIVEKWQKQFDAQTVRAPFSGNIRLDYTNPQNEAEKNVKQVVLYRDSFIEFQVDATQYEKTLRVGESGEIVTPTALGIKKGIGTVRKVPMKLAAGYADEDKVYCIDAVGDFLYGEKGTLTIVNETHTDVLCVPTRAVSRYKSDDYYVRVLAEDGYTRREVKVKIGIKNEDFTEIISGLNENDTVIVG